MFYVFLDIYNFSPSLQMQFKRSAGAVEVNAHTFIQVKAAKWPLLLLLLQGGLNKKIAFYTFSTNVTIRCTSIWTKLSYQFLDWSIVRHCPKGQLGQIWVKLGQNWGRARSRKNRSILEGKWGPVMQKIERFDKNWIFNGSKVYYY